MADTPEVTPDEVGLAASLGSEPLAEATIVNVVSAVPGAAVETQADRDARIGLEAEQALYPAHVVPEPVEYQGIVTNTPEGNLATRSNIVSDGPGTVQA